MPSDECWNIKRKLSNWIIRIISTFFIAHSIISNLHKKNIIYRWPDNILNQMKFTPDDIELFASVSGRERVEERRKFIQELMERAEKGS